MALPLLESAGIASGLNGVRSSVGYIGREVGARGLISYMKFNASAGNFLSGAASAIVTFNHRIGNEILHNLTRSRQYLNQIQNPPSFNINVNFDAANTLVRFYEFYNRILSRLP